MDSIKKRRSIRKYKDQSVEQDKVNQLLEAAMCAPSAGNQQPWEFVVVTNKEIKAKLSKAHQYCSFIKDAPLIIVPVFKTEGLVFPEYTYIDMANACENLWLEATDLNLGCVWIGIAPLEERISYVSDVLNLDAQHRAFALMSIGYPNEELKEKDCFDESRVTYIR